MYSEPIYGTRREEGKRGQLEETLNKLTATTDAHGPVPCGGAGC